MEKTPTFHVAMFPWLAMGHLTPYLHLSNKLAERGHAVSFLVPTKTQSKLQHLNLHPNLITFVPLTVPHVDGLPVGAETMLDVPLPKVSLFSTALDLMQHQIEIIMHNLRPDFIFFDLAHWIPSIAFSLGIKSIHFSIVGASNIGHHYVPSRKLGKGKEFFSVTEVMKPAEGYPCPSLQLRVFEARPRASSYTSEFGIGISFFDRLVSSLQDCNAICFRGCQEMEGPFHDFVESQYKKPILLTGPVLPDPPNCSLEEHWHKWLGGFEKGSLVYCALGSECILQKDQFQELVIGLELTGLPFLAILKPPFGVETLQDGLPDGFEERVQGRGVVHGGWVQQQLILKHPSVGCFVSHCGFGSMWESLVNDCQIVLLPHRGDQFTNTKIMTRELKVGVEVERREEDGWFSREDVCRAVELVMNEESDVGKDARANHAIWKDLLLKEGLESSYLNNFMTKLQDML